MVSGYTHCPVQLSRALLLAALVMLEGISQAVTPADIARETSVPALIALLHNDDAQLRYAAGRRLDDLYDPHVMDALLDTLNDPQPTTRAAAVYPLVPICLSHADAHIRYPHLVPALLGLLHDADKAVRSLTISALGRSHDATAVDALLALAGDVHNVDHPQIISALGNLQDPRAIPVLTVALWDEKLELRKSAIAALSGMKSQFAQMALLNRLQAIVTADDVVKIDQQTMAPFSPFMGGQGTEGSEAMQIIGVLQANQQSDLINTVSPLLTAERPLARATGLLLAARACNARLLEPAIMLLGDPDETVRWAAARALGKLGDVRALQPLLTALAGNTPRARAAAASALAAIGDRRAIEPLGPLLHAEDATVKEAAALALGQLGDARALDMVLAIMQDPDAHRRALATPILGAIGGSEALDALAKALDDPANVVRVQAIDALGQIRDPRAVDLLIHAMQQTLPGKPLAGQAQFNFDPMERLGNNYSALLDPHVEAVTVLGIMHDPRALDPLLQVLRSVNDVRGFEQVVPRALHGYREPRVLQALIDATKNGTYLAADMLLKDWGPEGIKALRQLYLEQPQTRPNIDMMFGYYIFMGNKLSDDTAQAFMGDPQMSEVLQAQLQDGTIYVTMLSGALKYAGSLPALLEKAQGTDRNAADWAMLAVVDICLAHPQTKPVQAAIPILEQMTHATTPTVAIQAELALIKLGKATTDALAPFLPALIAAAQGADSQQRMDALPMLCRFDTKAATDAYLSILRNPSADLRRDAVFSAMNTTNPRIKQAILALVADENDDVQSDALNVAERDLPESFPAIYARFNEDPVQRLPLAQFLLRASAPEGLSKQLALLHDPQLPKLDDPPNTLIDYPRIAAARALAKLGDVQAVEPLIAALDEGNLPCRQEMARALGQLMDRRAIPALISALERFSGAARFTAAEALTAISGQDFGKDPAKWQAWWKTQQPVQ